MKRDVALARLKPYERRLRERGISALYLFNSTARDEFSDSSDLDLLFEYDEGIGFSLFDQAGAMPDLSDSLGARINLVSRVGLRPRVRARVERVRWFEYFDFVVWFHPIAVPQSLMPQMLLVFRLTELSQIN